MSPLTVGVDARAAAEVPAGRGRYVREILRALSAGGGDERYVLYCRAPADGLELDDRFVWEPIRARDPLWHVVAARRATGTCDVFWSTNSYLTAWFTRIPTAVVVYDLVAFVEGANAQARAARIERATIGLALRRAGALLCISRATEHDLLARHPRAAGRTVVTPLAADPMFGTPPGDLAEVRARLGLERPFVLAAGTLEPRKNLLRLMEAWAGLDAGGHDLVLVGPPGWDFGAIVARARARDVRMLGFVSDADLAALYAQCEAFCYPSLYEGFGLPVLEAMAAGAAVITSTQSSLPEVAGDAALLVDPRDPTAIRDALQRLLDDPEERARLRAAGPPRAAQFSWEATATQTLRALRSLAGPMTTGGPDFSAGAPTPPARWKVRLVRQAARATPGPVRRRALAAWRARKRARRLAAERRGDFSLSRPALYGMADRLEPYLDRAPGFFVEAGANDGFDQSNTYHLERQLGWIGLLVEPVPELSALAAAERPRSRVVTCALVASGDERREVEIRYGGLRSVVAGAHGSEADDRAWVGPAFELGLEQAYSVTAPARTLSSLLDEMHAPEIDLLSLDVEGYEPQVLAGLDLERHAPRLALVEVIDDDARQRVEVVLGERYVAVERLSPFDVLYARSDQPAASTRS